MSRKITFSITPTIVGTISWNSGGDIIYFSPSPALGKQTNYSVKIDKSAMSNWDVPLSEDIELNFVTKANDNLSLIANFPKDGDIDIETDVTIMVQFDGYLNVSTLSVNGTVILQDNEGNKIPFSAKNLDFANGYFELLPNNELTENSLYQIILKAEIATTDGYTLGIEEIISFRTKSITSVEDINNPVSYNLISAYPNPFNPTTTLEYQLEQSSHVSIKIYDIIGNLVATLANRNVNAGTYKISFDAHNLPSGVYFSQIITNTDKKTIKLLLTK